MSSLNKNMADEASNVSQGTVKQDSSPAAPMSVGQALSAHGFTAKAPAEVDSAPNGSDAAPSDSDDHSDSDTFHSYCTDSSGAARRARERDLSFSDEYSDSDSDMGEGEVYAAALGMGVRVCTVSSAQMDALVAGLVARGKSLPAQEAETSEGAVAEDGSAEESLSQ